MGFATLFGVTIEGYGYGDTQEESKKLSLDDLSSNISVHVKSDYNSFVSADEKEVQKKIASLVSIKSELPIIGANFSYDEDTKSMVANLSSTHALKLYEQKLADFREEIGALQAKIDTTNDSDTLYGFYELLLLLLQAYEKHEVVALILGYERKETPQIAQTQVQAKMMELSKNITSIDLAAKLLAKKFPQQDIYVYPPSIRTSSETTPFARVFRDALHAKVAAVHTPAQSKHKLLGTYEPAKNGIFLTYTLLDVQNTTLASASLLLEKSAYSGLEIEPKNLSFDEEVELGKNKLTSDLRVDLSIKNFGSKNVLLREGQDVELVVKANRQAYFYIVGHTLHEDEKFSYLVEIQDGVGDERFIYTIGAADVNKPLLLPLEFSVSEPFGYESLQLFASTTIPNDLPRCRMKDGYCVLDGNPQDVVVTTRALKAKKAKELKAETTLHFTTVNK
jgi:hypothetical protein